MVFQMTVGATESPDDHQRSHQNLHVQDGSCMNCVNPSKTLTVSDEILLRRIKNRERQRRYRERKRLEADMQISHFISHRRERKRLEADMQISHFTHRRHFYTTKTTQNVTYETRVRSGRKWKKEARRVYFSTRSENAEFEGGLTEVEPVMEERRSQSGRRDWKADARKKTVLEGGDCDRIVFGLSVLSDLK